MRILKIVGLLLTIVTTQVCSQKSPYFYGWFFNETVASGLIQITTNYLTKLYADVEEVQKFLRNVSTTADIDNPLLYYTKPVDPNTGDYDKYFHITTFYCGTADCSNYTKQVTQYIDQAFTTHLVGVYFTPRTYGIRVNLTSVQREIFDLNEANAVTLSRFNRNAEPCDVQLVNGIQFCPQDDTNFHPTNTRAHVTLGCAPNISAVTTGLDLIEILNLEMNPSQFCAQIQIDEGNLIQMGEKCDIFVVYLKKKMVADSTFEAYYRSDAILTMSVPCRLQNFVFLLLLIAFHKALLQFN
ncbi:hypothetical protein HA402_006095 [Bradysia odoriphaga]|nr:hypothetical protein HA402_006095 [Bradysia odoriphaga]